MISPGGRCGGWAGALEIPGVTDSSGPKTSWCNRPLATPQVLRSWVRLRRNAGGPHRKKSAWRGAPSRWSTSRFRCPCASYT